MQPITSSDLQTNYNDIHYNYTPDIDDYISVTATRIPEYCNFSELVCMSSLSVPSSTKW